MAKTKQKPVSAAQRREREKQQRQQRLSSNQNNRSQTRNKGKKQSQSNMRQWLLIGGVLVVIAIIIGVFRYLFKSAIRKSKWANEGQFPGIQCSYEC